MQGRLKSDSIASWTSKGRNWLVILQAGLHKFWAGVCPCDSVCVWRRIVCIAAPSPVSCRTIPESHLVQQPLPLTLAPPVRLHHWRQVEGSNSEHTQREGRTGSYSRIMPITVDGPSVGKVPQTVIPHHSDGLAKPGITLTSLPLRW